MNQNPLFRSARACGAVLTVLALILNACQSPTTATPAPTAIVTEVLKPEATAEETALLATEIPSTQTADERATEQAALAESTAEAFIEKNGFYMGVSEDKEFAAVAISENGERFAAKTDVSSSGNITAVTGAAYLSADDELILVYFNEDGLPETAIFPTMIVRLSNYSGNQVDMELITPDGDTGKLFGVEINNAQLEEMHNLQKELVALQSGHRLAMPSTTAMKTVAVALKIASFGFSAVMCGVAVATASAATVATLGAAVVAYLPAVIPCSSTVVKLVGFFKPENTELQTTGAALGVVGCGLGAIAQAYEKCAGLFLTGMSALADQADREMIVAEKNALKACSVSPPSVYLRDGPNTAFGTLTVLYKSDTVQLINRDSKGDWVNVKTKAGQEGWIASASLSCKMPITDLAVASNIPKPPTTTGTGSTTGGNAGNSGNVGNQTNNQPAAGSTTGGTTSSGCQKPVIRDFHAEAATPGSGARYKLKWVVDGADKVEIFGNKVDPKSGSFDIYNPADWWVLWAQNSCDYVEYGIEVNPNFGSGSGGFSNVTVNQGTITISVRDYGQIDGDIINLVVNGVAVLSNYTLTGSYDVTVTLKSGANTVTVAALNEGQVSPNTVEIFISNVVAGSASQVSRGLRAGQSESFSITAP